MEKTISNDIRQTQLLIKKYLSLENVSFLTGAGTSFHLGAPVIRNIPDELKNICQEAINKYFPGGSIPSYEDLFNCLQADRYLSDKKCVCTCETESVMKKMQQWLFENCNTEKINLNSLYTEDVLLKENKYYYHETFVKKVLQRPNNLKRANLFTTNYDMAFDYALDNLGVHYINGFMGVHNRCFRPEVYEYDLYYPGQSVTGKVHRAEKVIKYYKIHGSLSWLATKPTFSNTYGIKEIPLNNDYLCDGEQDIMIYPCVSKKSFTLDLPYSELFRQFAQAINQPQSVLFCIGYSFFDEHINDIIHQALSIPSFTLIIVNYSPTIDPFSPIGKLRALKDKRIIILNEEDTDQSTFTGFVTNILPDLYEEDDNQMIIKTMQELYPQIKLDSEQSTKNEEPIIVNEDGSAQ